MLADRHLEIDEVGWDGEESAGTASLVVNITPARLERMVRRAVRMSWLLPPGFVSNGLVVRGCWAPDWLAEPGDGLDFEIVVARCAGPHPKAVLRYPLESLNRLVQDELAADLSSREDWVFGHYDLHYTLEFGTCRVHSGPDDLREPIEVRRFAFTSNGRVRLRFVDDVLKVRATGRVRELSGVLLARVVRDEHGVGFLYSFDLEKMRVNVHNLAPWGDDKVSEILKHSLSKSLNRKRKRARFARKRFPEWIPLDLILDLEVVL